MPNKSKLIHTKWLVPTLTLYNLKSRSRCQGSFYPEFDVKRSLRTIIDAEKADEDDGIRTVTDAKGAKGADGADWFVQKLIQKKPTEPTGSYRN